MWWIDRESTCGQMGTQQGWAKGEEKQENDKERHVLLLRWCNTTLKEFVLPTKVCAGKEDLAVWLLFFRISRRK